MAELNFRCEAEWVAAYDNAKEQGDTAKQDFESKYGTNFNDNL